MKGCPLARLDSGFAQIVAVSALLVHRDFIVSFHDAEGNGYFSMKRSLSGLDSGSVAPRLLAVAGLVSSHADAIGNVVFRLKLRGGLSSPPNLRVRNPTLYSELTKHGRITVPESDHCHSFMAAASERF